MADTILKTIINWLDKGYIIPALLLAGGVALVFLLKWIFKTTKERETYLIDTINDTKKEAKEDKQLLMDFITEQNKASNEALGEITTVIKGLQAQIEYNNKETNLRLDFIEKRLNKD